VFGFCLAGGLASAAEPVVVQGTVADETTRAAIVQRLRALYGPGLVVDQLVVGRVAADQTWAQQVQHALGPALRQVRKGQFRMEGNRLMIRGEVASAALRRQVAGDIMAGLESGYTLSNELRTDASVQQQLDATLALRTIEFETGAALLRPSGMQILDQIAVVLLQLQGRQLAVTGHTDNTGAPQANQALSLARAQAVRSYLAARGVAPEAISVDGMGAQHPLADNATAEGRARNRRIEFRVLERPAVTAASQ